MVFLNLYQHNLPNDKDLCTFFSDYHINKLSDILSTISNTYLTLLVTLLVLNTSYDLTLENYFHSFCSVSNVDIYNLIITLKLSSYFIIWLLF